uniref:F-box and WD domain protein n=1 Tax=Ganoderma boninense TaxID=34458 RepID=A0A5K1K920_9APHY|nr:F-box and WD domain protein [Ganoderma boninense]
MHTVNIRRPDSVLGSEDSDQPDFRLVIDSPTRSKPSGSPIRDSAVFDEEATVTPLRRSFAAQDPAPSNRESISSDVQDSPEGSAIVSDYLPSRRGSEVPELYPTLCRRESEVRIVSSPSRRASATPDPRSPAPSTTSVAPESVPLPPSRSPSPSPSSLVSEVPDIQPPTCSPSAIPSRPPPLPHRVANSHGSISSRDSISSVLLSPIDLTGARRISYTSVAGSFEHSFDSGYADAEPPRTPTRRLSTLSILSSPFGSPSSRARGAVGVGAIGENGLPTASALFSPRFSAFPNALARDAAQEEARHSRGGSVDSQLFTHEEEDEGDSDGEDADRDAEAGDGMAGLLSQFDDAAAHVEIQVQRQSMASESFRDVHRPADLEDSSSFGAADGPSQEHLDVSDDFLRAGEASFGSDDSMASLYDQYYTPTVHSYRAVGDSAVEDGQEASPTMVLGSFVQDSDVGHESSPIGLPYEQVEEEPLPDGHEDPEDDSPYDLDYLETEEASHGLVAHLHESSPRTVVASREPLPHVFTPPPEQLSEPLFASPGQPLVGVQARSPEMLVPPQGQSPQPFVALQEQSPEGSAVLQEHSPDASMAFQLPVWDDTGANLESSSLAEASEEASFVATDFYDEVSYVEPEEPEEDLASPVEDFQHARPSSAPIRSPSVGSSVSEAPRVFSPIQTRPPSSASSVPVPNFSLPNSARNSIVFAAPSRAASPAMSLPDDNAAGSTSRPSSSLSQHSGGLRRLSLQSAASVQSSHSSQSGSKKVPFGFRNSMSSSDRSQPRRSDSLRHKPPPLLSIDNAEEGPQSRCATPLSPVEEMPLTVSPSPSSSNPRRLKPLRLSMILSSSSSSLGSAIPASSIPSLTTATTATTAFTPSSPTVLSETSIPNPRPLSLSHSSTIPSRLYNTTGSSQPNSPLHIDPVITSSYPQPTSAPETRPPSWSNRFSRKSLLQRHSRHFSSSVDEEQQHHARSESRFSEPIDSFDERQEDEYYKYEAADQADETVRRPVSANPSHPQSSSIFAAQQTAQRKRLSAVSVRQSHRESLLVEPVHAIATPRPTLLFALASDDIEEVQRVLESGEAGVNDDVGPQSALAFTLSNPQLKNKMQMVKLLLAYGADTSVLHDPEEEEREERSSRRGSSRLSKLLEAVDPATRYHIERADSPQTRRASALIHRSYFRPLTRVRYDLIGQDRVLEQLFRVLSMPSMAPIVVLLCGPSGHGKSLLARKCKCIDYGLVLVIVFTDLAACCISHSVGSLLEVPTHTVNMTTLQNTGDIWKSHSIAPYGEPSNHSLKEFLIENEGKRCVVVLDEIEKTQDEKILSSLLMPWEYGRCSFEAGHRHVDVSKVIWLGTSNIGHDLVFEHQDKRPTPETQLSREEYIDLMALLRPRASDRLGPSLLSRVTAVLPFVAFTADEKLALAAEALHGLVGESVTDMPPATRDLIVRTSLNSYIPSEGARSLYRAVSTLLLDTI